MFRKFRNWLRDGSGGYNRNNRHDRRKENGIFGHAEMRYERDIRKRNRKQRKLARTYVRGWGATSRFRPKRKKYWWSN